MYQYSGSSVWAGWAATRTKTSSTPYRKYKFEYKN